MRRILFQRLCQKRLSLITGSTICLFGAISATRAIIACDEESKEEGNFFTHLLSSYVNIQVQVDSSSFFSQKWLISNGGGFIIRDDGLIVTNAHVVSDLVNGGKMVLTFSDGRIIEGKLFAMDSMSDLALVKPAVTESQIKFTPVTIGNSDQAKPGDPVYAIGNPLGLRSSLTSGIISYLERSSLEVNREKDSRLRYIQTSLLLCNGYSGGPLINSQGQVIGINSGRAEREGISFAIHINSVMEVVKQLLKSGKVIRPWFGFRIVTINNQIKRQIQNESQKIPPIDRGVLITSTIPGSPACQAKCKSGDIITYANDKRISSTNELMAAVGYNANTQVTFTIVSLITMDEFEDTKVNENSEIRLIGHKSVNGVPMMIVERRVAMKPDEFDLFIHKDSGEDL